MILRPPPGTFAVLISVETLLGASVGVMMTALGCLPAIVPGFAAMASAASLIAPRAIPPAFP